jgi:hypothetical protein
MHLRKIVARTLLILSILNSVPAAPVVRVREIPGARGAVAVRAPAEGVVAVLEKRDFDALEAAWFLLPDDKPASSKLPPPPKPASPKPGWKQNLKMSPENIKAAKHVGMAGLILTAVMLSVASSDLEPSDLEQWSPR